MTAGKGRDVTMLLRAWRDGVSGVESELFETVTRELRRIAVGYLRRERQGHSLQATELIDEAYLRLVGRRRFSWDDRAHFLGIAAQVMRRILVDHARRRRATKREGLTGTRVTLALVPGRDTGDALDVLALHEALQEMAALDARQAEIVAMRYFGGLTIDEIAANQAISPATVKRELLTAKVWLRAALLKGPSGR